jgi:hypothetical protein
MFHRDKLGIGESGPYLFSGFGAGTMGMATASQEQVQLAIHMDMCTMYTVEETGGFF